MYTREQIESALDCGMLSVRDSPARYWTVRRNGRTQTWKTRPADFRIPCKAGLRNTFQITHDNASDFGFLRIGTVPADWGKAAG